MASDYNEDDPQLSGREDNKCVCVCCCVCLCGGACVRARMCKD